MKFKKLLGIMLCFSMFATASIVFTSCDKDRNDPSSGYTQNGGNNGENNGGNNDENNGGNNGENNGGNNGENNGGNNGENNGGNNGENNGGNSGENNGDNNGNGSNFNIVETVEVMNVSSTSAVFKGKINNTNGTLEEYGFIYSTHSDVLYPHYTGNGGVAEKATFNDSHVETFTYKAEYLKKGETYYVRAYACAGGETYYGSTLQFTTVSDECYIKHPWAGGNWTWKKMDKSGNIFTYEGEWGGEGANINTTPDDAGAMWFPVDKIAGAPEFDYVSGDGIFSYDAEKGVLSFQITN